MGANAVTTVPVYTAGEVLTAADLNITNSGIPVFADSTARDNSFGGTGEKVLAEGQYAYLESTNATQVYDGAAWVAVNASGLTLVKSQVIGSAVSSVEVTGAFSTTYDTYLITVSGGVGSTEALVGLKLGATTTGYYMGGSVNDYTSGSATGVAVTNGAAFLRAGITTTTATSVNATLQNPFLSVATLIHVPYALASTSGNAGNFGGFLNNSTSYTAFTLTPASGTLTGGTIRVYGYANS
jgi:hypothetical protein